jgi:peptidoglycan/LPS O-acetylase OafA/YrhL
MPTREQLLNHALRQLAGAALIVLAAYASGEQQYAVIAAALVPSVLVDVLAMRDADRRRGLRVSKRPVVVLVACAVALAAAATVTWMTGDPLPAYLAALCAAAGLVVAGSPSSITFAPRAR